MPAKEFDAFTRLDASDVNAYLANRPLQNLVINGAFDFWQRGTSFTADGAYTADRWVMALSGATATTSRQTFTIGQTDVPGNPTYFLRFAVSTGDNAARIEQRIEDVTVSSGKTYTVSFWAKGTNPGGGVLEVVGRQEFGTGGSAGATVSAGTIVLTSSWQRFSKTFTYASVAGKTITSANQYWGFDIRQPVSDTSVAAWTLDIAQVQLEEGTVANDFRRNANSLQGELAACQRYFAALGPGAVGRAISGTSAAVGLNFPVEMRAAPTMTFAGNMTMLEVGVQFVTVTAASLAVDSAKTGAIALLTASLMTAPNLMIIASPQNLFFSAEL
jgi:hypothetical protein